MRRLASLALIVGLNLAATTHAAVDVFGSASVFGYSESSDATASLVYPGVATFTAETTLNTGAPSEVSDSMTGPTSVLSTSSWSAGTSEAETYADSVFFPPSDFFPLASAFALESGRGTASSTTVQDIVVSGTGTVTISLGIEVIADMIDGVDPGTHIFASISVFDSIGQSGSVEVELFGPGTDSAGSADTVELTYVATGTPTTYTYTIETMVMADTGVEPVVPQPASGLLLAGSISGLLISRRRTR